MKNTPLDNTKPGTPKTPGGISKALLTPCRRVGLSRNWRKSVASPFNSPLGSSEIKQDVGDTRKRKESLEETPKGIENCESENTGTPLRKIQLPRRKKSKILINSIATPDNDCPQPDPVNNIEFEQNESVSDNEKNNKTDKNICTQYTSKESTNEVITKNDSIAPNVVSTPVRLKSKSKGEKKSPRGTIIEKETEVTKVVDANHLEKENVEGNKQIKTKGIKQDQHKKDDSKTTEKVISPNNLTKECIVVIQKKIFKNQFNKKKIIEIDESKQTSQALFNDSDSDDVPLNCLSKSDKSEIITIDDDDDFTNKPKLKKTNSTKSKEKVAKQKDSKEINTKPIPHHPSQNSIDDDDEFFEKKKTILIRKSYDKVIKPSKAKSTGSITQKDIEDLKARIETKKKMLLAQSMTDTKELRELIKKWQKGCQDALMELMDLMKTKCPDQNMQYPQILQTLKIPADLVGYDSDNDCFITPEDTNIILSHIKE